MPGVQGRVADVILAEVGPTVEPFRSAAALAKWAGVAPGNKTSGGKRLSGRTTPGNRALRSVLVEAARGGGVPKPPTWARNVAGWCPDSARNERRWPWRTRSANASRSSSTAASRMRI